MEAKIIGHGLVSSIGGNVEECWQAMLTGKDGIREIDRFPIDDFARTSAGTLSPDVENALRDKWPEDDLALCMIRLAISEATSGIELDPSTGLIFGSNFGLMETREWCWRERIDTDEMDIDTFDIQQQFPQMIACELGVEGPVAHLSLSCASGAGAVALGWQWLLAKRCNRVLVVCYDAITEFCWCGLSNLRTITAETVRPFNKERSGTVFSEGAAAILLSNKGDDAATYFVAGAATNNNAYHMTAPAKEAEGSRRVMAEALRLSGFDNSAIDFVSAHATGTSANDVTESAAICKLLDDRPVPVAGFKSTLGHIMGGAGLAEIIISLKSIEEGRIPPIINTTEQDPECKVAAVIGCVHEGTFGTAITNSAGIGGNNASVVLSSNPAIGNIPSDLQVGCTGLSWVLPNEVGSGNSLPAIDVADAMQMNAELSSLNPKEYLQSVKGYLDPNSIYTLIAAALQLRDKPVVNPERTAVITATQYGATTSAYKFYELMVSKGHRFASPLVFPHSYSNTAGNLVAIEFGLSGPHLVFDLAADATEAVWAAKDLIRRGMADEAIVIVNEGTPANTIPDTLNVLHGAVCVRFGSNDSSDLNLEIRKQNGNTMGTVASLF